MPETYSLLCLKRLTGIITFTSLAILSSSVISRMTLHGFPTARTLAGISLNHHAFGSDDASLSDSNARKNRHICANPDIVSHSDRFGNLQSLITLPGHQRMNSSVHTAVWTDKAVVTDSYRCTIHKICVMINKGIITDAAVVSIIHIKRRQYGAPLSKLSQKLTYYSILFLVLPGSGMI